MGTADECIAQHRLFLPDLIKAAGCLLIVVHHLAFYGPMSDAVATAWPALVAWLHDDARLAVQGFLVVSGFLTARAWQATPAQGTAIVRQVVQRYLRLAMPLMAALSLTVIISELIRPVFNHPSLSPAPDWQQSLAHVFFLQHILDMQALSAGVWYVAIDLQLFALALISFRICGNAQHKLWWLWMIWLALCLCSVLWWNLQPQFDDWAIYFCAAYGMGLLAGLARLPHAGSAWPAALVLAVVGVTGWLHEPRDRLALACVLSLLLTLAPAQWMQGPGGIVRRAVDTLARWSFSVFVVHFGVGLAVNAVFDRWVPGTPGLQAWGMVCALLLSLLAGAALYHLVERPRPTPGRWAGLAGGFLASSALAMWLSG